MPTEDRKRFKEALLEKKEFVYTLELVTGRGSHGKSHDYILNIAEKAAASKLIHAVTITDNAGGHPALAPDVLGFEVSRLGIDPVIHFTCKDKNRNQIESILYSLERIGVSNLLVLTGDYPLYGFQGKAKPVFDLDSVQLLSLLRIMNIGLELNRNAPGGGVKVPPTNFFKGCAVSPFKKHESEVMAQYYKLFKKIEKGADFIVTQLGYDARKFDELHRYLKINNINAPVLGNIYVLNRGVARIMNQGGVAGCVVTDDLVRIIEKEAEAADKGKAARLLRAAKQTAIMRGIGFNGVHIGGPNLVYEDVEWIIEKSKELLPNWMDLVAEFSFPQKDGFYVYEKDLKSGLNNDNFSTGKGKAPKSIEYSIMRSIHRSFFDKNGPFYKPMKWILEKVDGTKFERPITELEYWIKFFSSRCRRCGDCMLPEIAFLCPNSQCAKFQVNGPCGGSVDGWCEVYPKKRKCIYVRAYTRLRPYDRQESLKKGYTPPRNWSLDGTSSWANYFLGRDHESKKYFKSNV